MMVLTSTDDFSGNSIKMISDHLQFHKRMFFNLNGYLLLMWMFSLHHDVMVETTREDEFRPGKSCKQCKRRLQTFCRKSRYFEDILSQISSTLE